MSFSKVIVGTMRLGSWGAAFSSSDYERFIEECLDLGLNDFDHADIYGGYTTEEEFGRVIKKRPDLKSRIRLTTKCSIMMPVDGRNSYPLKYYDSSAKHIKDSVDRSLQNLGVDQIEYLLLHRPDYWLDAEEVSETVNALKSAGKVLHFGVSNYTRSQMSYLQSKIELDVNQMEISVNHPDAFEDGSLDYCKEKSIAITAWSPLGGGKIFESNPDKRTKGIQQKVKQLAKKYECREDQILLSWLSTHPAGIIPVLGTSKIERIKSALKATAIKMERNDWYALLEASIGHELA